LIDAELEPNLRALFHAGAKAYEISNANRALEGLKNQSSGRFIQLKVSEKLERQLLKKPPFHQNY